MGIDYDGKMMIGVDYEDLPEEVLKEIEEKFEGDIYEFMEANELDSASLWYNADIDGMIIGKIIRATTKYELDTWLEYVKKEFEEVESILKVKCMLLGTQDIY